MTNPAIVASTGDPAEAPALADQPLLRGARWASLWVMFNQVTKIVRGAIIPRILDPASYGLWTSLSVILGYAQYGDLGVNEQLAKRLPYRLSRDGEAGFKQLAGEGAGWGLIASGTVAAALFAWSFFYVGPAPEFYRPALRLLAAVVIAQKLRYMGAVLLGSSFRFREVSVGILMIDGVGLILAIVLLLTIGVMGLLVSLLATEVLVATYFFSRIGFPRPSFHFARTFAMVREGLILFGVVLAEQGLMTVDQLLLLTWFSRHDYGIYALGLFLVSALLAASGVMLNVTQPKVMHLAGNGQLDEALAVVRMSFTLYAFLLASIIGVAVFAMDMMVTFYLTRYREGMATFVLMPLLALVRGPVILLRPMFLARNREKTLITIELIGLTLAGVCGLTVVWLYPSLPLVAAGSVAGYAVVAVLTFRTIRADMSSSSDSGDRHLAFVVGASIIGVLGLFAFYAVHSLSSRAAAGYVADALGACLLYTAWVALAVWAGRASWRSAWRFFKTGQLPASATDREC